MKLILAIGMLIVIASSAKKSQALKNKLLKNKEPTNYSLLNPNTDILSFGVQTLQMAPDMPLSSEQIESKEKYGDMEYLGKLKSGLIND